MAQPRLFGVVVAAVVLGGCYRGTDGGAGNDGDGGGSADAADDGDSGDPVDEESFGAADMRQLSAWEYANTIRDLFGETVYTAVVPALAAIPAAQVDGGYSTMDRSITAAHVDAYYAVALAVATTVSADPQLRGELAPCLAAPDDVDACGIDLATGFGLRAYRRPLTQDERDAVLAAFGDPAAKTLETRVENAILYMLMAPQFLYRPEVEGAQLDAARVYRLSPYEVASRLSYFLWGTMPDPELFDAAATDALDAEGIRAQAQRMLASPRARDGVLRFVAEWLTLADRPGLGFSPRFLDGLPTEGLRDDILAELPRLAEQLIFDDAAGYSALLTSQVGFVDTPGLAEIYGVGAPGGGAVDLGPQRRGMLTRAALLLGTGDETHPIVRGAFIARRLLCLEIAPPNADDFEPGAFDPPPFDPDKSSRQRWEEKTAPKGCNSCHQVINPLGFAAEGFDSLGRVRTTEDVIDPNGEIVGTQPIDTATTVTVDEQTYDVAHIAALSDVLAQSVDAPTCFGRQWFRYGYGRYEVVEDAATVEALAPVDGSLLDMVLEFVTAPEFRHVKLAE